MGSKKTKTKNEPWAPAQPYILKGMAATNDVFDANQPHLERMSQALYGAADQMAPSAFGATPYVDNAQAAAQTISNGFFLGANPGQRTYDRLQNPQAPIARNGPALGGPARQMPLPASPGSIDAARSGTSHAVTRPQIPEGAGFRASRATAADPSMGMLAGMASEATTGAGDGALAGLLTPRTNAADRFATAAAKGDYLNAQPSSGVYSQMMDQGYSTSNPYLDDIIRQTNENVTRDTNRLFASRGMGAGLSSAFADVASRNLADAGNALRYQNYNDAENRRLAAAGQSDAAWSGERDRMAAATGLLSSSHNAAQDRIMAAAQALNAGDQQSADRRLAAAQALGGQYSAGQDRALSRYSGDQDRALSRYSGDQDRALTAARAADEAQSNQVQQMLAALGLTGDLRNAEYAGVAPTLSVINSAADLPYIGIGALNGNIRTASNGYGVQTTKESGGLGGVLGGALGSFASGFGGGLGGAWGKAIG